ncbi:MAG: gamma-glutamyl-gamma-aminobutyrate hydrolase family protein [Clostridia bacterium]|nr:gamma-glutamyl-gamma-aminobutyrate hydrolase family protein [Clostridia bacterium]
MGVKILLSTDNNPESYALYVDAIRACGAEPTRMYCPAASTEYDGLIVCGGVDVHPARYGEAVDGAVNMDEARDAAEIALVEAFLKAGKPIFGICRGHQLLNVIFGGTLVQHLPNALEHSTVLAGHDIVHEVTAQKGSIAEKLYGESFTVNSWHHQAVQDLADGFFVTLRASDGVIEGYEPEKLPVFGVQWHPERMCCTRKRDDTVDGSAIFEYFIRLCEEKN